MDTWVGEILLVSSLFSIGIGLSNSNEELMVNKIAGLFGFAVDTETFLYLGFFTALASLSSWTVRLHWRTITQKLSLNQGEPDKDLRESKRVLILDNLFHYSGALTMLMVASAITRTLDLLLIILSIIIGVYLLGIMYRILRKARSLEADGSE
jgi:L-asparagine transporter-like permease